MYLSSGGSIGGRGVPGVGTPPPPTFVTKLCFKKIKITHFEGGTPSPLKTKFNSRHPRSFKNSLIHPCYLSSDTEQSVYTHKKQVKLVQTQNIGGASIPNWLSNDTYLNVARQKLRVGYLTLKFWFFFFFIQICINKSL